MNDVLAQVWTASATAERMRWEMDQADASLDQAIVEALAAGESLDSIRDAANLTPAELTRRIRAFDFSLRTHPAGLAAPA